MTKKLFALRNEIPTGVAPSLPNQEATLWADARNVSFSERALQPQPAHFLFNLKPSADRVTGLVEWTQLDVASAIYGTEKKLYLLDSDGGSPSEVGTGFTGNYDQVGDQLSQSWSLDRWGEWILASNDKEPVQVFKGTSFAPLDVGGEFVNASLIRVMSPIAIALNTSVGSRVISWSDKDNVEDWPPVLTNLAGNLEPFELETGPIAAELLGSQGMAVYTANSMHILRFVGDPFVVGSFPLLTGIGAVGKNAVAAIGELHYGMSKIGPWVTDGVTFRYIDAPDVKDFIQGNINRDQISKTLVYHDQMQGYIMFSFPIGTSLENNITLGYRPATNIGRDQDSNDHWILMSMARTVATSSAVYDFMLAGDTNGNIWQQSIPGSIGIGQTEPENTLILPAVADFGIGFGDGGFGETGFGGEWDAEG